MKSGINYPDHPMIPLIDKYGKPVRRNGRIKKTPDFKANKGSESFYFRSFLTKYFLKKDISIGNEKRFIKEKFFKPHLRLKPDGQDKRYIRSVLGLCDGVEYKGDKKKGRNGKISYKSKEIERFKSPITFKIVGKYTVLIPEDYPKKKLSNVDFTFTHEFAKDRKTAETILTPGEDMFDLVPFLKDYVQYFNNLDITKIKGNSSNQAKMIEHAKQSTLQTYEQRGHHG